MFEDHFMPHSGILGIKAVPTLARLRTSRCELRASVGVWGCQALPCTVLPPLARAQQPPEAQARSFMVRNRRPTPTSIGCHGKREVIPLPWQCYNLLLIALCGIEVLSFVSPLVLR